MTLKSITGGVGIIVSGGQPNFTQIDMAAVGAGMVRYNSNRFEVFDGTTWKSVTASDCNLDLSQPVIDLLTWVRQKMQDEEVRGGASAWSPEAVELLSWVKQKKIEEELGVHNDENSELMAWIKVKKQEDELLSRRRQEETAHSRKLQDLRKFEEEENARRKAEEQAKLAEEQRLLAEEQRRLVEEQSIKANLITLEELAKQSMAKAKKKKKPVATEETKPETNDFLLTIPIPKPPEERMW
jgi:hypothetical protein